MNEYPEIYPHSAAIARQNGELDQFRESNSINRDCVKAIDAAIRDNNYKLYHYDLQVAAKSVIDEYGAERVQTMLAHAVREMDWDGRFSDNNKEWAKNFEIPKFEQSGFVAQTHPAILDGFIKQVRGAVVEKEVQPVKPIETPTEYKYYSVMRPVDIGTIPREPKPDKIDNFDWRIPVEDGKFSAWGAITYKQPLTEKQVDDYELRPASTNPRERVSVLDSLKDKKDIASTPMPEKKTADKPNPER